jgi:hypothetical protein
MEAIHGSTGSDAKASVVVGHIALVRPPPAVDGELGTTRTELLNAAAGVRRKERRAATSGELAARP